jgi:hypothetical protein
MVFVPDPPLDEALLGLGTSVARAVPSDLVVAVLSQVLPAALVQRLVLAAVLVLGAWGAARLLPAAGLLPGAVAGTAYVWTAATYERLVLGQWALLVSLAALPWVVAAAAQVRAGGPPRAWAVLVVALAGAAVGSPAGGLLLCAVAPSSWSRAAGACARRRRPPLSAGCSCCRGRCRACCAPAGSPPTRPASRRSPPRADTPLGTLGSLLTLGGVWNAQVVPPGRDSWLVALGALAVVAAGLAGAWTLRSRPWAAALAGCAVGGLLVAVLPSLPGGPGLAAALPGGGLLRDGQKYAAPYALLVAVGLGAAASRVPAPAGVAVLLAPLALVPGPSPAARPDASTPSTLPRRRGCVRALVDDVARRRRLAAVGAPTAGPEWNARRTVLDPVPRLLGVPVVVDDDLVLADRVVRARTRRRPRSTTSCPPTPGRDRARAAGHRLGGAGEGRAGQRAGAGRLAGARLVHDGPAYALYRPDPRAAPDRPEPPAAAGGPGRRGALLGGALGCYRPRVPTTERLGAVNDAIANAGAAVVRRRAAQLAALGIISSANSTPAPSTSRS